jgi:hypothetical protein
MTDSDHRETQAHQYAEEISRHVRVVPWRLRDRLLFFAIAAVAVVTFALNIVVLLARG